LRLALNSASGDDSPACAARAVGALLGAGLLAGILAGCSASRDAPSPTGRSADNWADLVDRNIADPDRARRLRALGERLGVLREAYVREAGMLDAKALALNSDYDATREEADLVMAQFASRRQAVLAEYRDVIFAMRRETSAAEWRALTR
jgi:hypothetical protein